MKKTAVFKDELFLKHMAGFNHLESASRLEVIYDALATEQIGKKLIYPQFSAASRDILTLNHKERYINRVAATAGKEYSSIDPDTKTSPQSFDAATLAVGAAITGAKMIINGDISNAFCLVRPPGHHAEYDMGRGFCLFNNAAIAAHYATDHLKLKRVLLVDWDLHHGNGTQHSFYNTNKVLYFSTHQYPYYPGTGKAKETGKGKGEGFTINVPLPAGLEDSGYCAIFNQLLTPLAKQYKPELIILSAGYDIHRNDPLGGMGVTAAGFAYLTKILVDLANELCNDRLLVCLEGGYDLDGLREGVLTTLSEMAGQSILTSEQLNNYATDSYPYPIMALEETRSIANKYWNL